MTNSECWKCGKPSVYYRKFEGKSWCKSHFSKQLEEKVRKTIRDTKMIKKGDRICVALSGGKDSSLTLKIIKEVTDTWPDVEVFALLIDEGIKGYRNESVEIAKSICENLNIPLTIASYKDNIGKELDEIMKDPKNIRACTYCGVFRRYLLNKKSRELGATKLATGHNLDDELQSVFMNYLKGDLSRMSRMGATPTVVNEDEFIPRIKPLRNIPEREIGLYCLLNDIEFHDDECPNANDSVRFDVRDWLNRMEDRYPGTKNTSIAAFDSMLPLVQGHFKKEGSEPKKCIGCGELTSKEICKKCELVKVIFEKD